MKKLISVLVILSIAVFAFAGGSKDAGGGASGVIKVGIINNPPSESGYRTANDQDFKSVFTAANGYDPSFSYSIRIEEQLAAFNQYVTD
ncbi:MAG: sugar ABC transporter substrate-binding protein, partial [Treponema sp.]|nr:sugar ABC transporter substrate-binding protein [Treponema sp.]